MKKVGVLALQGAFVEHATVLRELGVEPLLIRQPTQLAGLDGLIIPGGESTAISHLIEDLRLAPPLQEKAAQGFPIMGTCAGLILLAKRVRTLSQEPLGLLDIVVVRNAYGRQMDSFEAEVDISALGPQPFPAVFIRAPVIEEVGPQVEVLARLGEGSPVAVKQGNLLGTTFHPELSADRRFHTYFLGLLDGQRREGGG